MIKVSATMKVRLETARQYRRRFGDVAIPEWLQYRMAATVAALDANDRARATAAMTRPPRGDSHGSAR